MRFFSLASCLPNFVFLSALLPYFCYGEFLKLIETCNTEKGRGICVKDGYCCKAVNGEVLDAIVKPHPRSQAKFNDFFRNENIVSNNVVDSNTVPYKVPYQYQYQFLARSIKGSAARHGRQLGYQELRDDEISVDERTSGEHGSRQPGLCSYEQVCCVIRTMPESEGCLTCGVKGNGDRNPAMLPPQELTTVPTTQAPTRAPANRIKNLHLKERSYVQNRQLHERALDRETPNRFNFQSRILGGFDADPNEWCWQVALMNSSGLFGSGALISSRHVLTAAHTIRGRYFSDFILVLGDYDFIQQEGERVYYSQPTDVWVHPDYNPATFENDIAVIEIPEVPCQGPSICTICLPEQPITFPEITTTPPPTTQEPVTRTTPPTRAPVTTMDSVYGYDSLIGFDVNSAIQRQKNQLINSNQFQEPQNTFSPEVDDIEGANPEMNPHVNKPCYMTGWGATRLAEMSVRLQELPTRIIGNQKCAAALDNAGVEGFEMPATMFCGNGAVPDSGSCDRDGGSPLVCQNENLAWQLAGIIALGTDSCRTNGGTSPTLFVNVGLYLDWIKGKVGDYLPNPPPPGTTTPAPPTPSPPTPPPPTPSVPTDPPPTPTEPTTTTAAPKPYGTYGGSSGFQYYPYPSLPLPYNNNAVYGRKAAPPAKQPAIFGRSQL